MVLLAAALWLGSGLVSRMVLAYRLNNTVKQMQADNQRLAQNNAGYQQQLQALARPDGAEEQARAHNYVRPDEKVYVVTQPSPNPAAAPAATVPRKPSAPAPQSSFWADFWNALTSPFR